jgi:hypothetical protein
MRNSLCRNHCARSEGCPHSSTGAQRFLSCGRVVCLLSEVQGLNTSHLGYRAHNVSGTLCVPPPAAHRPPTPTNASRRCPVPDTFLRVHAAPRAEGPARRPALASGRGNDAVPDTSFGPTGQFFAFCSAPFRWIHRRMIMDGGRQGAADSFLRPFRHDRRTKQRARAEGPRTGNGTAPGRCPSSRSTRSAPAASDTVSHVARRPDRAPTLGPSPGTDRDPGTTRSGVAHSARVARRGTGDYSALTLTLSRRERGELQNAL